LLAIFAIYSEKRPLTVKFSKLCSESFDRLTDRRYSVEISWNVTDRKSAKSCVIYLRNKKIGCLSSCRYCADRAQNLSGPVQNNVLTMLQILSKSVHFLRS